MVREKGIAIHSDTINDLYMTIGLLHDHTINDHYMMRFRGFPTNTVTV